MFNLVVNGVVDKMLLEAHIVVISFAWTLNMNDFMHVVPKYLPQSSTIASPSTILPATTLLPPCELPPVQERPPVEGTMCRP